MLRRIRRLRCPACGQGRLFRRYFVRKDVCGHCGWRFERGEGHWVGGSEVHMLASYALSMLVAIPVIVFYPATPVAYLIVGHVALSIALFRYSRAVFLGVDYLIDPHQPTNEDDDGFDDGLRRLLDRPPSGGALETRRDERHIVARR